MVKMTSKALIWLSLLLRVTNLAANSITFIRQGQLVLRPEYGRIYSEFTVDSLLTVHNLLLDRLETTLAFQNVTEERKQRMHLLELQEDRMLTVWHLLQDKLSVPLPSRPINRFNITLFNILLNQPDSTLSREESFITQQVLDQPRTKEVTGNSNEDILRQTLKNLTMPDHIAVIEEQEVVDRALGETRVLNTTTRAPVPTTRTKEKPKARPGRSARVALSIPQVEEPQGTPKPPPLWIWLPGDSLFIMKTCQYLTEVLESEEMQIHDRDGGEINSVLAALDSIFAQYSKEFTDALKDFGLALTTLRQGQISPLLFHSRDLTDAIVGLQNLAQEQGLHPVYRSLSQLLQTLHPWVAVDASDLTVQFDIEVPYSREDPASLYRYVPSPWATKYYYLRIEPERIYLAFDREHRYVAELDVPTINGCQEVQGVWLCKGPMTIHRQPEKSCLYNLYHQRTRGIENSCPVQVGSPREEVARLLQNLYQITSPQTLTMLTDCENQDPRASSFTGQRLINLTHDCPRITAGEQIFLHQTQGHDTEQLQRMNLTEDTAIWLENLLSDPREWVLSKLLKDLEKIFAKPVPLCALKDHIGKFIWEQVKDALVYVVLTGFPLLCISVLGLCCRGCKHNFEDVFPPESVSTADTAWPVERFPLRSARLLPLERL